MAGRTFVNNWELEELSKLSSNGLKRRSFDSGRKMFAAGDATHAIVLGTRRNERT